MKRGLKRAFNLKLSLHNNLKRLKRVEESCKTGSKTHCSQQCNVLFIRFREEKKKIKLLMLNIRPNIVFGYVT